MRIHVMMMVRNEKDRHLNRSIGSALSIAGASDGKVLVTDDASDDGTWPHLEYMRESDKRLILNQNSSPQFMKHEGRARQRHYEWVEEHVEPGDWILSLDADETINSKYHLINQANIAERTGKKVVLLPLYEFWSTFKYRTDGFWFGTKASRLFRYELGGGIRNKEFGCGSEPTYVGDHVRRGRAHHQADAHLLHWGYVREEDRVRKHAIYTGRDGGHGHNDKHVQSIISVPTLADYMGETDGH